MNSWSQTHICFVTFRGNPKLTVFHEFIAEIMNFGPFSWTKSYLKLSLKKLIKISVKYVSEFICFLWNLVWIAYHDLLPWAQCNVWCCQLMMLPAHDAAAPESPASLSASLFGRAIVPIPGYYQPPRSHHTHSLGYKSTNLNLVVMISDLSAKSHHCRWLTVAPEQFKISPVTSAWVQVHSSIALLKVLIKSC